MRQCQSTLLVSGLLLGLALLASPQVAQAAMDWQGLQEAWNAYYQSPSEAGAEKILNLLPGNVKIAEVNEGSLIINSIYEHLSILEGEIFFGNPNAIKLGFRLYTVSYGAFEAALNRIIGNLIVFSPKLFLEELASQRGLLPVLDPILGSFLNDFSDNPAGLELERKLRINMLGTVEDKALKSLRNECIKILKKL